MILNNMNVMIYLILTFIYILLNLYYSFYMEGGKYLPDKLYHIFGCITINLISFTLIYWAVVLIFRAFLKLFNMY